MSDRIVITSHMTNRPIMNGDDEVVWFTSGAYALKFNAEQFGSMTLNRVTLMPLNREFMYDFEATPTQDPHVDEFNL